MTTHHKQVPLSDAVPGMLLWDAVADSHGNVLLSAGTVLTTAILASLQRHQIEMLAIAGAALSDAEELARSTRQAGRIAWLFRKPGSATSLATAALSDGAAAADEAGHGGTATSATAMLHRYVTNFRSGTLP
ncbi:MAG: hypothetical protein H7234_04710 [Herminiimonas sp.]|nr:hypothetical protein [Herminiimonas sp.]